MKFLNDSDLEVAGNLVFPLPDGFFCFRQTEKHSKFKQGPRFVDML